MEFFNQFRLLIPLVLAMTVLLAVLYCRRSDEEKYAQRMLKSSVPNQNSQKAESAPAGEAKVVFSSQKAVKVSLDRSSDLISVDFPESTKVTDIVKFYQSVSGKQVRIDPKLDLKAKIDADQPLWKEEALEFLPRQQNLWVHSGVGSFPS